MSKIFLGKNKYAIVDKSDFDSLSKHTWSIDSLGYPRSMVNSKTTRMHRFLIKIKKGYCCDHINLNKLDNRRSNLRICTKSENGKNKSLYITNTSGYKGVSFIPRLKKYEAYIHIDYKKINLGLYKNAKEAAKIYNINAIKFHKKFAKLNHL